MLCRVLTRVYHVVTFTLLFLLLLLFLFFSEEKSQLPGFELTSQRVRRLRGYQLSYRGDRLVPYNFCPFCYTASVERWDRGVVIGLPVDIVYLMYRSKPMSGQ